MPATGSSLPYLSLKELGGKIRHADKEIMESHTSEQRLNEEKVTHVMGQNPKVLFSYLNRTKKKNLGGKHENDHKKMYKMLID